MPSEKPHRIRVRVRDGKPRKHNKLKGRLVPHVDVIDVKDGVEFVICAVKEAHLDQIRAKFGTAGLEEIPGGDTDVSLFRRKAASARGHQEERQRQRPETPRKEFRSRESKLKPKPYGFAPLPANLTAAPPVWHDGTGAESRLSGEIRCEVETLTPLLVGWERRRIDDTAEPWAVSHIPASGGDLNTFLEQAARQTHPDAERRNQQRNVERARQEFIDRARGDVVELSLMEAGRTVKTKSVLCPLRAPWGEKPVLLPGDSIKGLLRHELGALLGAPMERVAERSYSYRPNSLFPKDPNPWLVARLAQVPHDGIEMKPLASNDAGTQRVRVPVKLDLLPENLKYDPHHSSNPPRYRFDTAGGAVYRGGQGAGNKLNSKRKLHERLEANPMSPTTSVPVPESVQSEYVNTLRHLTDLSHGHFSERHPDVPQMVQGEDARQRILDAATTTVFTPADLIWVEWDSQKQCIVSLGWHYYYRWAYVDTVRKKGWTLERYGLFPLDAERRSDEEGAPQGLSAVRRLFGYTSDNDGSIGIGRDDHEQLMGRISVNAAVEVIEDSDTHEARFLPPTFLRELGMPRPSAVEHYLKQPYASKQKQRPSDRARLVTYGDAAGYDEPGELAGRKFYFDRKDAYTDEPWKDESEANRLNERSTLALEASRPGRRFRFTIRFRDLDPAELAAVLAGLCPNQFREVLGGDHTDGYCSKLGYARPFGWGSVRIAAKELLMLDTSGDKPTLDRVISLSDWLREHHAPTPMLQSWLAIHRHKHPDAGDYPRGQDGNVYSYHTKLRAEHTRARRYEPGSSR